MIIICGPGNGRPSTGAATPKILVGAAIFALSPSLSMRHEQASGPMRAAKYAAANYIRISNQHSRSLLGPTRIGNCGLPKWLALLFVRLYSRLVHSNSSRGDGQSSGSFGAQWARTALDIAHMPPTSACSGSRKSQSNSIQSDSVPFHSIRSNSIRLIDRSAASTHSLARSGPTICQSNSMSLSWRDICPFVCDKSGAASWPGPAGPRLIKFQCRMRQK